MIHHSNKRYKGEHSFACICMCVKLCADQLFSLAVMDSLVTWTQVCVLLGVAKVNLCFECVKLCADQLFSLAVL